ncbi:hypothetical protein A8708_02380 [Paenibacillus oryzisoli]|uniref:Uncharacterized protein n=1 Tax=Paenibacillus oryzisoli TaxID=1850517 RepID=A0A198A7N3_9BACL|nr:hypothetical protein A8708_02380 [Paenibacillus oryzisoli]
MFTWVKFILAIIHFVPMVLFSLLLFRIRIKPYWKQISVAVLVGALLSVINNSPLISVCIISILLMCVWKYRFVPALLIALSGYIMPVLISTTVIVCISLTQDEVYNVMKNDSAIFYVTRLFILLGVVTFLMTLYKRRLGFTFLSHYTRIPFNRENVGAYLYMIVVIIGMVYRHAFSDNVFSVVMPIQLLSMATILFFYVMLSKELGIQR